eukprot:2568597-Amphidinium_carterae.1
MRGGELLTVPNANAGVAVGAIPTVWLSSTVPTLHPVCVHMSACQWTQALVTSVDCRRRGNNMNVGSCTFQLNTKHHMKNPIHGLTHLAASLKVLEQPPPAKKVRLS